MEKKQFENDNFVLYAPDSLNYICYDLEEILNETLFEYKELFDIDEFRKVQINYFDDLDDFREYIYQLRGNRDSLPSYARGTFDNGMINAYIEKDIDKSSNKYLKRKYNASHELFHIMYKELVLDKNNTKRVIWFDEGMAQLFSHEYDYILNEDFMTFFNKVFNSTKEVPELNKLDHGSRFETDTYSGYKLSLLAVKYLYDTLTYEEFKSLLKDYNQIIEYGNNIVNKMFDYYQITYNISK